MSYVLGLDLSLTSTGRAGIYRNAPPTTDTICSGTAGQDYADRWVRLVTTTDRILDQRPPLLAVLEGPSYGSARGGQSGHHDRAGLWWRVLSELFDAHVPVAVVAPTTRAKWATGRGNAGKSEVAVAVARLWPDHDARTDDEWDALALATMGAQHLGWNMPTRAHHALTLAAITWPTTREPATPQHPAQAG